MASNICEESKNILRGKWTDGCTPRINKLRDQYWTNKPTLDAERALSYTRTYKENEAEEPIIKRAKSLYSYIEKKTIQIQPDELIVGVYGNQPRAAVVCPEICWMWYRDELDTTATRLQDPYQVPEEVKKILREEVFPYWEGKSMEEYFITNLDEEVKKVAFNTGVVQGENKSQAGAGEFSAGYGNIIIKKGFKGIQKEAEVNLLNLDKKDIQNFDKKKFYEAVIIICEAVKMHSHRYAEKAMELAISENDEKRKKELLKIAEICERVPYNPPQTFHEAIQAVWFTQIMLFSEENTTSFTIDRPDQYLYPFFKKEKEAGTLTDLEAQELLECLWIKMAEIIYVISESASVYFSGYQPFHGMTLGGIKEDGQSAVNEISYIAIQSTMNLRMHAPTINIRVNKNTPDEFFMKICDLIEMGTGQPAVFFDETAMKLLRRNGIEDKDLWNWCVAGCVEPQVPGKLNLWDEGGRYSYATAVEWTLFNGESKALGRKLGLETGEPTNFKTYSEFERAVEKQLAHMLEMACRSCQIIEKAHKVHLPKPLRSCCVEGCIEKGIDVQSGGAYYNLGPGIEATGVADIADSMAAIKKLVFEEHRITMAELIKALEADFIGYYDIQQMLISEAPKYGNDDDYVDSIARHFVELSCEYCEQYISINGSKYLNGVVPAAANIPHGEVTWTLPSGRKARLPLADGISPYVGYDKCGPSALVKSVCKVDHYKNGVGTLLNIKFSPNMLKSVNDKKNLIALLKSERDLGGYHVQFNVISTETLRDAQKKPQNYGDLLVRVAGYSAYFVELRKEAQESIIARTENKSW